MIALWMQARSELAAISLPLLLPLAVFVSYLWNCKFAKWKALENFRFIYQIHLQRPVRQCGIISFFLPHFANSKLVKLPGPLLVAGSAQISHDHSKAFSLVLDSRILSQSVSQSSVYQSVRQSSYPVLDFRASDNDTWHDPN